MIEHLLSRNKALGPRYKIVTSQSRNASLEEKELLSKNNCPFIGRKEICSMTPYNKARRKLRVFWKAFSRLASSAICLSSAITLGL